MMKSFTNPPEKKVEIEEITPSFVLTDADITACGGVQARLADLVKASTMKNTAQIEDAPPVTQVPPDADFAACGEANTTFADLVKAGGGHASQIRKQPQPLGFIV